VNKPESISLTNGPLKFSGLSQGEGPLVLLLHGFPDNTRSWRHQLPVLAEAGYKAVAVTLRGYEPASQPADNDYSLDALAGDVVACLDGLAADTAHLVGHDWGAAIGYKACADAPERFSSLTALSVPHTGRFLSEAMLHPRQLRLSWYMFFFQLRGLAEHIIARRDYQFIRMLWRQWSPGWDIPEAELDSVVETFRQAGILRGALQYYRAALAPSALPISPSARKASRFQVPVNTLAITGANDCCIDADVFSQLMYTEDFPAGLELKKVAAAGHFPHQEQAEAFNDLLLNCLQRNEP
jgi:pimeloyl-ACP methyl ester carboxylesterase